MTPLTPSAHVFCLQDANGEEQTVAVVPDSALGPAPGGSGIDMMSAGPGSSIDADQLGTDVSLTDAGLPTELLGAPAEGTNELPPSAVPEMDGEQPRRPTTPGGRRRVNDQAVQKSKQDMQNCFGFDVSAAPGDWVFTELDGWNVGRGKAGET